MGVPSAFANLQPSVSRHRLSPASVGLSIGSSRRSSALSAETEQALTWGLSQGIRRFQGRHVDAMLAAGRIGACAQGGGCTLRQCIERASATGPGGRAGCNNPTLLDAASPLPALSPVAV